MQETITLVIPTIRENSFNDFVKRWLDVGLFDHIDRFIVMEDNPKRTFQIPDALRGQCAIEHYCWEDIEEDLGDSSWIIPRRSDTVRSYGYLKAAVGRFDKNKIEQDYQVLSDYILTLDDDCYPCTEKDGLVYDGAGFLKAHIDNLNGDRWFNTLNNVKPRGIPFYNLGSHADRIIVNHGLWTNVLDYDAPYQLANPIKEDFSFDSRIVPAGQYFPMCGMNVMWRSYATPLMYHLLMGRRRPALPGVTGVDSDGLLRLPFDRFGDIWCGIFMKKIADELRLGVKTGMPYIRHERASNPFTNLKKEANGIEVNEDLWVHVDDFQPHQDEHFGIAYLYGELGKHMMKFTEKFPKYKEHEEYFVLLGKAMVEWSELFK